MTLSLAHTQVTATRTPDIVGLGDSALVRLERRVLRVVLAGLGVAGKVDGEVAVEGHDSPHPSPLP